MGQVNWTRVRMALLNDNYHTDTDTIQTLARYQHEANRRRLEALNAELDRILASKRVGESRENK